jgi:putative transposase
MFGIRAEDLWNPGEYSKVVAARSLLSYWAVRELGISATELARRMKPTQPAVSISVKRGEQIAQEKHLRISDK